MLQGSRLVTKGQRLLCSSVGKQQPAHGVRKAGTVRLRIPELLCGSSSFGCVESSSIYRSTMSATVSNANPVLEPVITKRSRAAVQAALDLKLHGWAYVEDVLTGAECSSYVDSMFDWLEGLGSGFSRHDKDTWREPYMPAMFNGILNYLEIPHQDFVWRVRTNPNILEIFAALWGTNELLSSFDSVNVMAPGTAPSRSWLHTDQRPTAQGLTCVQGLVNLVDVSEDTTGTLLVKAKSHMSHQNFFQTASEVPVEEQRGIQDFYVFKDKEVHFWDNFESVPVRGKAGSLFLWDSRTAHMNACTQTTSSFRHVVYTCYQPRELATEADLMVKEEAWRNYLTTTHWPAASVALHRPGKAYFGKEGSATEVELASKRTRDRVDTPQLRQLAGIEQYPPAAVWHSTPLLDMSVEELSALL